MEGIYLITVQFSNERLGIYLDAVEPERPLNSAYSVVVCFISAGR
jgi:hypothetical protein